jgi:ABC-type molybdenum transport system ATPase subunit/photorepair protein PhrA
LGVDLDSRVAIVGANGTGKSTLLKLMTGQLEPVDGIVKRHNHLRIGVYHQHLVGVGCLACRTRVLGCVCSGVCDSVAAVCLPACLQSSWRWKSAHRLLLACSAAARAAATTDGAARP